MNKTMTEEQENKALDEYERPYSYEVEEQTECKHENGFVTLEKQTFCLGETESITVECNNIDCSFLKEVKVCLEELS